jgi:hypothetical protein
MTFDELSRHVKRLHRQIEEEVKIKKEQNAKIEREAKRGRRR